MNDRVRVLEDRIVSLLSEARAVTQDLAREADELKSRVRALESSFRNTIVEYDPLDEPTNPTGVHARLL